MNYSKSKTVIDMNKLLKNEVFLFLKGEKTTHYHQIFIVWNNTDPEIQHLIRFYLNGGSYKSAPSSFFISESTFYHRIARFFKSVEILIKISNLQ